MGVEVIAQKQLMEASSPPGGGVRYDTATQAYLTYYSDTTMFCFEPCSPLSIYLGGAPSKVVNIYRCTPGDIRPGVNRRFARTTSSSISRQTRPSTSTETTSEEQDEPEGKEGRLSRGGVCLPRSGWPTGAAAPKGEARQERPTATQSTKQVFFGTQGWMYSWPFLCVCCCGPVCLRSGGDGVCCYFDNQ